MYKGLQAQKEHHGDLLGFSAAWSLHCSSASLGATKAGATLLITIINLAAGEVMHIH